LGTEAKRDLLDAIRTRAAPAAGRLESVVDVERRATSLLARRSSQPAMNDRKIQFLDAAVHSQPCVFDRCLRAAQQSGVKTFIK
jgi:hypothetical protein